MASERVLVGRTQVEDYDLPLNSPKRKRHGIYYTPPIAAQVMARWAIRSHQERILEPCFGSGVFLRAVQQALGTDSGQIHGIEMSESAYRTSIESGLIEMSHSTLGDFLSVTPFEVDVAIGNPPYVRLRSLPTDQEDRAKKTTQMVLGTPMNAAGSIWMAFVLHASRFLANGGRFAFVLPYEITHVRYAKPLWNYLANNFGSLRVVRVKERLFPELMQEAIILFADDRGMSTDTVRFEAYESTQALEMARPVVNKELSIRSIVEERPFVRALLPNDLDTLLQDQIRTSTSPIPDVCTFNIGYVSGNKAFFHPDQGTVTRFRLPQASLLNTVVASRELSGVGIRTSSIEPENLRKLFYPAGALSASELGYIRQGQLDEVAAGYKCKNRNPWYIVPDVRIPDVVLSVFKEVPALVSNDANLVARNSILCGFLHDGYTAEQLISAWYTSLTRLYCELQVHALGGGVLVLIPGEVAKIRIPPPSSLPTAHIEDIDRALIESTNPYENGDTPVLMNSMGLSSEDVSLIRDGIHTLTSWRTAYRNKK